MFKGLEAGQRQAAIELSQDAVDVTNQNYEEGKNVIGRANDSYTNRVILHGRSSPDMADELSERLYSRGIILKNDEKGEATSDYDEEKRQREFEEGVKRNNTRDDSKPG